MKNIWPRYMGEDQYEFVFLRDYPSLVASNSDDPPHSFYSKDIFTPHPTIPDAWKYLDRLDDRVTLMNGEKVLPLPIEGRIREQSLVREVIVFGVARPIPGLLVFRSEDAKNMADEEFVDHIWSDVKEANLAAEGFSQIGKEMIVPLPANAEYPQADKGSFIRPQVYVAYKKEINEAYDRLEQQQQEGTLRLDVPRLEAHLLSLARSLIGQQLENKTTDFFSAGMDSLRAIQMRGLIIKDLDLGGKSKNLNHNIVFETSNVENLARYLHGLQNDQISANKDSKVLMTEMIEKYSVFKQYSPGTVAVPETYTLILTGATGGLGSQLLSKLSFDSSVSRIYCLVRGSNPSSRVHDSLWGRNLDVINSKIVALTSDLCNPTLGLDEATYADIKSSVTHIIHAAWPVNFQLSLSSFEPQVQGLHNLLQLSLSSSYSTPSRLLFCSSVAAALGTPSPAKIPEAIVENLDHASSMGYGQSKLVSEHILRAAVETAGAQASILRIGQVVGDSKHGMWTDREAIPAIVRSALTMGILPELKILCQWLPVDTLADCILEIGGLFQRSSNGGHDSTTGDNNIEVDGEAATNSITAKEPNKTGANNTAKDNASLSLVYNLLSPHTIPWTSTLLPALHATTLPAFKSVPTEKWLQHLRTLAASSSSTDPAANPDKNPAIKLIQFYESDFLRDEAKDGRVEFEIGESMSSCGSLKAVEDVVGSGLMTKMVEWWMGRWVGKGVGNQEGKTGLDGRDGVNGLRTEECFPGSMNGNEDRIEGEVGVGRASSGGINRNVESVEEGGIKKKRRVTEGWQ